jgi:hypothetical protein
MGILSTLAAGATVAVAGPAAKTESVAGPIAFPDAGREATFTVTGIRPEMRFDEVIPSWNVQPAKGASIRIELRGRNGAETTKWFRLADWSLDGQLWPRESLNGQKDADGDVLTDTLRFFRRFEELDLQVTMRWSGLGERPQLRLMTLAYADRERIVPNDRAQRTGAWGKFVDVPERAQGNYPRGNVLCSPTCVSMMLWHWSEVLKRPELDRDVPEVEAGVWDPVYRGAGNWPFNTAYAGSFPGIRGYVARFTSIADLERWTEVGVPVVCSVSLNLLRGMPPKGDTGHLVILVGFTADGDPIFNDPAKRDEVRRIFRRADFERAWLNSRRTVYLIHPENVRIPKGGNGLWLE